MSRSRTALVELLGPVVLVVIVGLLSTQVSLSNELYFLNAIVAVAMVVAVYVFVGNSGVLSFGQISFVAVGGFASGLMTIPVESKSGVLPDLFRPTPDYILRGYGADDRIVYGSGAVVPTHKICGRAHELLERDDIAYVHMRSARNNCYQCRIERA